MIKGTLRRIYRNVECPELGGVVRLQSLTGEEIKELQESNRNPDKNSVRLQLIVRSVVDKAGKRIMSNDDMILLGNASAAAIGRLVAVIMKLNGWDKKMIEWSFELSSPEAGCYLLPMLSISWEDGFGIYVGWLFWLFSVERKEIG